MNTELQSFCRCSNDYVYGTSSRSVQQKEYYNDQDSDCIRNESDRDDKFLNDWKVLDDDSWDVISALRQKFCQLSRSEAESATVKESPHSSYTYTNTNREPYEFNSIVERASNLIDYTPESEFLKKIKQQCQYLQNRLPNIFSALNDCFPEGEIIYECQKCLLSRPRAQLSNSRSWRCCSQQSDFTDEISCRNKNRVKHSSIFQRPSSGRERSYPLERLNECEKQSEHVSRSKKPTRRRKLKKRKSNESEKCVSENDFEPSLKKPNENSCERCWRFASPARSPVNKPDQRFDPNFRRGHSTTNFEKGDGDPEACAEEGGLNESEQRNVVSDAERESPCARHTCNVTSRSPRPSSTPYTAPHICIKQKMEAAWQINPNECPKHRGAAQPSEPQNPPEYVCLPSSPQQTCPKHKGSFQQPVNPPPAQHLCPKHMGSFQQPEPSTSRPRAKCPVHAPEPSQQRSPEQMSPQQRSPEQMSHQQRSPQQAYPQPRSLEQTYPQQRSPQQAFPQTKPPQHTCSQQKSLEPTFPQQRSPLQPFPQARPLQQPCPQQRSPQPGTSYDGKHTCKQPEEPSRGILCSNSTRKSRPQSCVSGSRDLAKSPCPFIDDVDVTEYREVCAKTRKQNFPQSSDLSSKPDSSKRTSPTCGGCPPKPGRTCDHSKMETIPERGASSKKKSSKDGDGVGNGNANNNGNRNSNATANGNANGNGNGRGSKSSKSPSLGGDSKGSGGKKDKSEKSRAAGDSKKGKSLTGADSKRSSKKGKSDGDSKSKRGKSPKKSPDKGRLTAKGRGGEKKGSGTAGSCAKKASPFDKAHPIRPCKCPPRIPENEQSCGSKENGGHTLCCHCDWGEANRPPNNAPQRPGNGSQGCSCNPTRKSAPPEPMSPVFKAGTMECPYRTFMNKFGSGRGQGLNCSAPQENHQSSRETHSEISTQELLNCSPRKYFVFYMANAKEKSENDMEVLVEELAQGCPKNDAGSRTKDIAEKMKKINEPPPDSMALRFQKGVSDACNVPQSSRILYF